MPRTTNTLASVPLLIQGGADWRAPALTGVLFASIVLLAGCGASALPSPLPTATPAATVLHTATRAPSLPERTSIDFHDARDLEKLLPAAVADRPLYRWSVRGTHFFGNVMGMTDNELAALESDLAVDGLVLDDFSVAFAGRVELADPPYFVRVIRVRNVSAKALPLEFGVDYPEAGDFERVTIGGKPVWRGVPEMVAQTDHQRGIPYVYLTRESMFTVVTEDRLWATDALSQLP